MIIYLKNVIIHANVSINAGEGGDYIFNSATNTTIDGADGADFTQQQFDCFTHTGSFALNAALGGAAPVSTVIGEALGDSEDGAVLVAIDDELDIEVPCSTQVAEGQAVVVTLSGGVPVDVTGGVVRFYGELSSLPVKYFARLPYVSAYGDNAALPYQRDQALKIAALAAIYALNKHEFNVSQDLLLMGMGVQNGAAGQ